MLPKTIRIGDDVLNVVEQPDEVFRQTGNIFIKRMYLARKGYTCAGHSHTFDHISLLAHGSVAMTIGINGHGTHKAFKAPAFIDVEAGKHHRFEALEDETVLYCVHDTRGMDVDLLGEPY